MATDPRLLLAAASIFGGGGGGQSPNITDPRVRAMFGLPPLVAGPPVAQPIMAAPAAPVAAPQQSPWTANPLGMFAASPQGANEPNIGYAVRHAIGSPFRAANAAIDDVSKFASEATDTPAAAAARGRSQQQGAGGGGGGSDSAFPTSYSDPAYDQFEAAYAQGAGNPTLADGLAKLRMLGERSNAGQTSSAGAKTPYQITPQTRASIMKQYGFDPWSSPQNAVRGAALAMTAYTGLNANYSDPNVLAKAAGGYFAGAKGAANPFGSASDGANTTAQYVQRVLGPNTPLSAPFTNPYNPAYDKAALGQVDAEGKALMTPFSVSTNVGPPPQLPKPEAAPPTDFSQSDAALANMKPVEMTEKEKIQRERTGFFKGIGEAMSSMPGNEGIGTMLMRIGGGALQGRSQADEGVQKEAEKFSDEMARYNAAVYQNDLMKAETHSKEAQQIVQQNNAYNMDNWKVGYDRWLGNGKIDISGTNAIVTKKDDQGNMTVSTVPIAGAVNAAMAQQRAQIFEHAGGESLQGNAQVTSMNNAIVGRQAIVSMMTRSGTPEADGAAAAAPAFYGTFIATHGLTSDLLGADAAKSLEKSVQQQLQGQQLMPGSQEWAQRHDQMIATEITKLGLASPQVMHRMIQVGGVANSFQALSALQKARSSTSTDSKGMPTTRSTEPTFQGNAADLFDVSQQ